LDTILKGTHPRTIPARFSVIWFSGFRGEDLNVILSVYITFYVTQCYNKHYKFLEKKQKAREYQLLKIELA
jgi:hypothetical protein